MKIQPGHREALAWLKGLLDGTKFAHCHGRNFTVAILDKMREKNPENERLESKNHSLLGGGFKHFLFSPLFGEDSHFD